MSGCLAAGGGAKVTGFVGEGTGPSDKLANPPNEGVGPVLEWLDWAL